MFQNDNEKTNEVLSGIQAHLDYLKEEGVIDVVLPEVEAGIQEEGAAMPRKKGKHKLTFEQKREALLILRDEVLPCMKCSELARSRNKVVFGSGNANAKLMFIGEAPGRDEDLQGFPFVGRAGQLLTKMIESIKLTREQVFIANVLKCRPPNNRNPLPNEIQNCEPFLLKQLEIIQPKVICALGTYAAQTLLKTDLPISALRGKFHDYHGIPLIPTYHPAYLLRNPDGKKPVWQDLKKIHQQLVKK